jgi:hypothetical protein
MGIATQLKIAKDTAKRAIRCLRAEGLLDDAWNLTISEDAKTIWADQPQPEEKKAAEESNFILATKVVKLFQEGYRPQFDKDFPSTRDHIKDLIRLMKEADYGSQQVREFLLEELPEMCKVGKDDHPGWFSIYLDCYLNRCVWQTFYTAEKFTAKNRAMGRFHGPNSLGVFRNLSKSIFRLMKARQVDEGLDGVLRMSPKFDKFLHPEA